MTERRDYTLGVMAQGEAPDDMLGIVVHPGAGPLLVLGVELVREGFARDPEATLAKLAGVAARGAEPIAIPSELLTTA